MLERLDSAKVVVCHGKVFWRLATRWRFIGSNTAAAALISGKTRVCSARIQDGFTNRDEFQAVLERDQPLDPIPV